VHMYLHSMTFAEPQAGTATPLRLLPVRVDEADRSRWNAAARYGEAGATWAAWLASRRRACHRRDVAEVARSLPLDTAFLDLGGVSFAKSSLQRKEVIQ
jgi:hypothetical protein